jgi:PIN domain nuclease of toxin-antitoxin system
MVAVPVLSKKEIVNSVTLSFELPSPCALYLTSCEERELFNSVNNVPSALFIGSKRLQKKLKEKIDAVRNLGGRLLVPTIVLAEALDIAEKGRVDFDFDAMYRRIVEEPEFEIVGFSPEIFEVAVRLRDVKEIHDRIITATARFYRVGVLTKDKVINESGALEP